MKINDFYGNDFLEKALKEIKPYEEIKNMKKKMVKEGICPHCNKIMNYENGENGETTEFWWECDCGRSYNPNDGKDITDYSCINVE